MSLNITTADFKTNRHLTILSTRSRLRSDLLREDVTTSETDSSIVVTWLQRPLTNGRHLEATASTLFNKKHLWQYGELCHLIQSCRSHSWGMSLQYYHHLHYGGRDPQVITWIVKFICEKSTSKSAVNFNCVSRTHQSCSSWFTITNVPLKTGIIGSQGSETWWPQSFTSA